MAPAPQPVSGVSTLKKQVHKRGLPRSVPHPVLLGAGVHALDPQRAHVALLLLAVPVRVLQRLLHALLCYAVAVFAAAAEAFGHLEELVACRHATAWLAAPAQGRPSRRAPLVGCGGATVPVSSVTVLSLDLEVARK